MSDSSNGNGNGNGNGATMARVRRISSVVLLILGVVFVTLSLSAESIGLNFTQGFGIAQIFQLIIGITFATLAAYIYILNQRLPDPPRSLQADIGARLAATGLVFCYVAGFADLLQIGTHLRDCTNGLVVAGIDCGPFIGPWQFAGILVAVLLIIIGLTLYATSRGTRPTSLLKFLIREDS